MSAASRPGPATVWPWTSGRTARTPSACSPRSATRAHVRKASSGSPSDGANGRVLGAHASSRPAGRRPVVLRPLVGQRARRDGGHHGPVARGRSGRRPRPTRRSRRCAGPTRVTDRRTSSSRDGRTIASIRSCDSDVRISNGSMPGSRSGTASRSRSAPRPARGGRLADRAREPAPPRSFRPSSRSALDELEARLDQELLHERVADLDARRREASEPSSSVARGQHRDAADAVASGGGADRAPAASRAAACAPGGHQPRPHRREADAHHVHGRVGRVGLAEAAPRRRRSARRCSCRSRRCRRRRPANSQRFRASVERAEPQRIEQRRRAARPSRRCRARCRRRRSPRPGTARSRSGASATPS